MLAPPKLFIVTAVSAAMAAAAIAGCGKKGPQIAPVTGKVTFEGKTLPGPAVINFVSDEGFGSSCELQADGTFSLGSEYGSGIPLGKYHVSISPPVPSPTDVKLVKQPSYDYIPQKYRDFGTNDWMAEIKADGDNRFDFDMKR